MCLTDRDVAMMMGRPADRRILSQKENTTVSFQEMFRFQSSYIPVSAYCNWVVVEVSEEHRTFNESFFFFFHHQ